MRKRFKVNQQKSRKQFSKSAKRTHVKNVMGPSPIMRGGIRL